MASETEEYEIKCEIRCCSICSNWIDYPKTLVIINRKHYHKNCLIFLCREFLHTQRLVPYLNPSPPCPQPYPH